MYTFYLKDFKTDDNFPFFIQHGKHQGDLYMHSHGDFTELTIVMSGEAVHVVGEENFNIKKGDVFVLRGGTFHGYKEPKNFTIINIMFKEDYFRFREVDLFNMIGFQALFYVEPEYLVNHGFMSRLFINDEIMNKVRTITDSMFDEFAEKRAGYQTAITAALLYLIRILSDEYPKDKPEENKKAEVYAVANAVSYIASHIGENISVEFLAEAAGYSRRHFTRLFNEVYDMPPMEYILSLRIENAARLLRETLLSVDEISVRCGFNSISYFYRIFKEKMGTSPKKYRDR